jgi:hypothetical protein
MFASAVLEEAFLRTIIGGTSEARKPYEQRHLVLGIARCLRRQVEVEGHVTTRGFGRVA